jgi:hypothetical protein
LGCTTSSKNNAAAAKPEVFYEMITYYAASGKLKSLDNRFRTHTTRIMARNGMKNIGYWLPVNNPENKLVYLLAFPNRQARDEAWQRFNQDPAWQAVVKATEVNGRLVNKAESIYLKTTDYSPVPKLDSHSQPRSFELQTFIASPGNIGNLHARFRNFANQLYEKHGLTTIGYWQPTDRDKETRSNMLIYMVANANSEAGEASFKAVLEDPQWQKVFRASEREGGGSLITKAESVYMVPTDYSPLK